MIIINNVGCSKIVGEGFIVGGGGEKIIIIVSVWSGDEGILIKLIILLLSLILINYKRI